MGTFRTTIPQLDPRFQQYFEELHGDEFTAYHMRNVHNRLQQRLGWMTRIHPLLLPSGNGYCLFIPTPSVLHHCHHGGWRKDLGDHRR
jgi:hypothetical protein